MRLLGLSGMASALNTSTSAHPAHQIYPYLLRGKAIDRLGQVWSMDISYILLRQGFVDLVAVMDWLAGRSSAVGRDQSWFMKRERTMSESVVCGRADGVCHAFGRIVLPTAAQEGRTPGSIAVAAEDFEQRHEEVDDIQIETDD